MLTADINKMSSPHMSPSTPVKCMDDPAHSLSTPQDVEGLLGLLHRHRSQIHVHMAELFACEEQLAERLLKQLDAKPSDGFVTQNACADSHAGQQQKGAEETGTGLSSDREEWAIQVSNASWNRDVTVFSEEDILDFHKAGIPTLGNGETTPDRTQSSPSLGGVGASRVQRLVADPRFDTFFGVIIGINSILMGVEVQLRATHAPQNAITAVEVLHRICGALFIVELTLRICADRWSFFFCSNQWFWNYLDIVLVVSSCFEIAVDLVRDLGDVEVVGVRSLSTARILRVLRITRVIRVLRAAKLVSFLRSLRILLHSIVNTLKEVFWTLLLVGLIVYIFAIVLTQAAIDHIKMVGDDATLRLQWGTLIKSSLTLFYCITGGLDWGQAFETLSKVGTAYALVFFVYVTFMIFAVLNAITGAFCQAALDSQSHDRELQTFDLLNTRRDQLNSMAAMFMNMIQAIDANCSGEITIEEFEKAVSDEAVQVVLAALDFEPQDVWIIFRLLGKGKSGQLDVEEFVKGCLRMKGTARSIDLAKFMHESKVRQKQNAKFMKYVSEQFASLRAGPPAPSCDHSAKGKREL